MGLSFWVKTSGTWINLATVLSGTLLGLTLTHRLQPKLQLSITQGLGLITVWLGLSLANSLETVKAGEIAGVILGLIALTFGGIVGEWWSVEEKLTKLGDWLKVHVRGQGKFTEGFLSASLLFCLGPMTLVGSLNNGLTGDNSLLVVKATMDGLAAIVLTSTYGIGVGFSGLTILFYQGGISLLAGYLAVFMTEPATNPQILLITGVGGLIILGIGTNLLKITQIRVASFLPSLLLAPLLYWLSLIIQG
ncbi:MAG: DUF554 domain-containing protein [Cyanobacteria bacterium J083]|nr:MAG: DUF554 domain-containing protein [Cyanobacteria bacterium J083]